MSELNEAAEGYHLAYRILRLSDGSFALYKPLTYFDEGPIALGELSTIAAAIPTIPELFLQDLADRAEHSKRFREMFGESFKETAGQGSLLALLGLEKKQPPLVRRKL